MPIVMQKTEEQKKANLLGEILEHPLVQSWILNGHLLIWHTSYLEQIIKKYILHLVIPMPKNQQQVTKSLFARAKSRSYTDSIFTNSVPNELHPQLSIDNDISLL